MKSHGLLKSATLVLGAVGTVLPASVVTAAGRVGSQTVVDSTDTRASSAASKQPAVKIADVVLGKKGELTGIVVNEQGKVLIRSKVVVKRGRKAVARTTTNDAGQFRVEGLRGGVYQIVHAAGISVFRVWANGTAPKSAKTNALIVVRKRLVRGQNGVGPLGFIQPGTLAATASGITGVTLGVIGISEASEANDEADAANAKLDALLATLN